MFTGKHRRKDYQSTCSNIIFLKYKLITSYGIIYNIHIYYVYLIHMDAYNTYNIKHDTYYIHI